MLSEFDFKSPATLDECLAVMMAEEQSVAPIAGGTNLVIDLRNGHAQPQTVVNLWQLSGLSYLRQENGHVAIGGRTTVTELLNSPLILETGRSIVESADLFASALIRNRATVGGNLADASPAADLAPPLLALGADVVLSSQNETRVVPLDEFFVAPRRTVRQANELLTEIRYRRPSEKGKSTFLKLGLRLEDAISVVSVAAYLECEGDVCQTVRIALGAVAPTPRRAKSAEALLIGQPLTDALIRQAAQVAASQDASPIDDVRASAEYRRWMVEVMVRRAVMSLFKEEN